MGFFLNRAYQTDYRRALRRDFTTAECFYWTAVRNKGLGFICRRQYGIGIFIVDFFFPEVDLVVEIDGDVHKNKMVMARDFERQCFLESYEFTVMRFTNEEIYHDLPMVLEKTKQALLQKK